MFGNDYKILFAGPMGAGKTTAIRSISEIEPVSTEAFNTTRDVSDKATTTVAFDYGQVTLDGGESLRLYGAPGQDRFNAMWEILARGALGVVILIDHSSDRSPEDLRFFLDVFDEQIRSAAAVIGLTHMDEAIEKSPEVYYEGLEERGLILPVLPVDAREAEEVSALIDALLTILESRLDEEEGALAAAQAAEVQD
ncbi:MAG: ATP/GTP-binding protein [Bryobacterales bacterium]|nr:ATP/GTP-binding protein [Acidobacteriota bacterium]MCB9384279.1 ATP/GTP-binding protein [Bryobacterales bacterium]